MSYRYQVTQVISTHPVEEGDHLVYDLYRGDSFTHTLPTTTVELEYLDVKVRLGDKLYDLEGNPEEARL